MTRRPERRGPGAGGYGGLPGRILALAPLLSVLPSCGDARARPRIGVILPLTGELRSGSEALRDGLELARERLGVAVDFLYVDDGNDPARSADRVHELDASEGVDAIVGPASSACALAAADRAESLKIPLLTPSATNEEVTRNRTWVFRSCFTDGRQGSALARFARRRGLQRAVIARDLTNDYSLGLAQSFAETFVRDGGDVEGEFGFRGGRAEDGAAFARWLEGKACDAIFLPGYAGDVAAILNASADVWRDRGLVFLGGDGWGGSDLPSLLREWPKEVVITSHFAPDDEDPAVVDFVRGYRERYGAGRPLTPFTALGYDAGSLLLEALRAGARGREGIRAALDASLAHFRGVTGTIEEDPATSLPVKEVRLQRWAGEGWEGMRGGG